ncbi:hypothetical protein BKA66DRAFT_456953 [Pyrenochaeta sp. MPI-SDFR-AT-0127]|nr:hypothetical protein BKA66DRAFT_456953 [Pyrenochaeta sp. MPI-SDFR-AT-0127]
MADLDMECDTDDVSLNSTPQSSVKSSYGIEDVRAERIERYPNGIEESKYLCRWENYAIHRWTWEPAVNLESTDVVSVWQARRQAMDEDKFQADNAQVIEEYDRAHQISEASTKLRREKRAKKRKQLAMSARESLAEREAKDASQLNSLFVDSQDVILSEQASPVHQNDGDLLIRQTPIIRKPPLYQSSSSSSGEESMETSEDSFMGELQTMSKRKATGGNSRDDQPRSPERVDKANQSSMKNIVHDPKLKRTTKPSEAHAQREQETSRLAGSTAGPANRAQRWQSSAQRTIESVKKAQRTTIPVSHSASSTQSKTSSATIVVGSTTATSTASTKSAPGGIRFVNERKPEPKQRRSGDKLYKNMHFRHAADVRSRREGTPELGELDFVNTPADFVKPKPRLPSDNPYSRRETGTRHLQEDGWNDIPNTAQVSAGVPLESWEIEKVPLVCPDWRLGNNCPNGPQKCHFMHRNQDADGRNYPVGETSGWLPPKYRKPPIMCLYWFTSKAGCRKTDSDCPYAHRNTGLVPVSIKAPYELRKINPEDRPVFEKYPYHSSQPGLSGGDQTKTRPTDMTCWYWATSICRKAPEDCVFQHHDTGVIADPPSHTRIKPGQPANDPRSVITQRSSSSAYGKSGNVSPPNTQVRIATEMNGASQPVGVCEPVQPPPATELPPARAMCFQLNSKIEQTCKLDFTDMFTSSGDDKVKSLTEFRAFLIYHPQEHSEELELITRWLLMHRVKVSNAWYDGSWISFKQQLVDGGSGIIIAHPDFENFTEMSGFGQVLKKQLRLWSIGLQPGPEYDAALCDSPPEFGHHRVEIFPLGGFIYITDEVFEKSPQVALKIVQLFFAKIKSLQQVTGPISPWHEVADASLLWRLCVRPELMESLILRCEHHAKDLEAGNADVQSCAELYTMLSETNYIEQDDPIAPLSLVPDKYPILSERRVIANVPPVEYFKTLTRSQNDANLHMLRYYAGLQVDMRRDYRHFYVVHIEPGAPCVQQWKEEIQTISDVITPAQCVDELMKCGEESIFDFCERYMARV